ncbi:MAG: UpxY family transcription antiterminator [Bacteroidales bacterium]|nr:UpxY family transcription antiterminator [Bacteroidales bacterium]
MTKDKGIHWFAIRVSYGRVLKFCAGLEEIGVEHFVPMTRKKVVKDGKTVTLIVPAISNLCFVRSTKAWLRDRFNEMGESRPAHFIWDKHSREPIVVSDKAMADFMQVCRIMSDDALYIKDITDKLREGQKVRVIEGPFKGVEGTILRIKRSRRVVVELPGLLAVATSYIDPRSLEVI